MRNSGIVNGENAGVILSGGGARGAYQAGVLKAFAEVAVKLHCPQPAAVWTGVSAGAINAAGMVAGADDILGAADKLCASWANLRTEQVFRIDAPTASKLGIRLAVDAAFGALYGRKLSRSLLDTAPLWETLRERIDFPAIDQNIRSGRVRALAVSATDYSSSHSLAFVHTATPHESWTRLRRRSIDAQIGVEHIMASSSIPLFFPPIDIGGKHLGDGCVRNTAPLSPALHLGSEKLLVISVRRPDPPMSEPTPTVDPSLARVLGVVMNALLMDSMEYDMERLARINQATRALSQADRERLDLWPISSLWIRPTQDISSIAGEMFEKLPRVIRYLISGLGSRDEAADLTSYLLFEPEYCKKLIDLGYSDAQARSDEIADFLTLNAKAA